MFSVRSGIFGIVGVIAVVLGAGPVWAANCPSPAVAGSRVFTVDPASSCFASGTGNKSNDATFQALLAANKYVLLDKSDDTTSGAVPGLLTLTPPTSGLSGTWSIGATALYNTFILALKSGEGTLDPDWGAFLLAGLSGTWSISGAQALSHGSLYRRLSAVPLPPAVLLFGSALAGLGFLTIRRRRKAAN